jgi:hypothetical protein
MPKGTRPRKRLSRKRHLTRSGAIVRKDKEFIDDRGNIRKPKRADLFDDLF